MAKQQEQALNGYKHDPSSSSGCSKYYLCILRLAIIAACVLIPCSPGIFRLVVPGCHNRAFFPGDSGSKLQLIMIWNICGMAFWGDRTGLYFVRLVYAWNFHDASRFIVDYLEQMVRTRQDLVICKSADTVIVMSPQRSLSHRALGVRADARDDE